jgi:hypothetical protein
VAQLFTPAGVNLRVQLQFYDVSPSGELAVDYPAFDTPVPGDVRLVDLRTGAIIATEHHEAFYDVCCTTWQNDAVVLQPCDHQAPPVLMRLPPDRRDQRR